MARKDEAKVSIDRYKKQAMKNTSENLKAIRDFLNIRQEDMCERLGGVSRSTYCNYEKGNMLPNYGEIAYLRDDLLSNPDGKPIISFDVGAFFDRKLELPKGELNKKTSRHQHLVGSYIGYYNDLSEKNTYSDSDSRYMLKYLVLLLFERICLSGEIELVVFCSTFDNIGDASDFKEKFKNRISVPVSTHDYEILKTELNSEVNNKKRSIYEGKTSFFTSGIFKITASDTDNRDELSILLYMPASDDEYLGGLGLISSVTEKESVFIKAQRILLSRYLIQFDENRISSYIKGEMPDIMIANEVNEIAQDYTSIFQLDENYLKREDKINILEHRLLSLIDTVYADYFNTYIGANKDDEKRVKDLLKHFSDK